MKKILFFFFILFFSTTLMAQDFLKQDLRSINVDQLSDADILKYQQQLKSSGVSQDQAEQIAASRGMPATEIAKLKQRLLSINNFSSYGNKRNQPDTVGRYQSRRDSTDTNRAAKPLIDPKIFGSELFNSTSLTFEPNLKIATPLNYEIGPDDQLLVSVYGVQEVSYELPVSVEGSISIPNVGQVKLIGLTIEAATQRIKENMSRTAYGSLRTGASRLSVSLSRIRSIRVTIIGSNRPGNYTLSSLSTVFNALFTCGGPSTNGSFREIELIRNNKLYKKIDLYRFLVNGDQSDNISLRDNDVIRIPAYKSRVELEGFVKRPGIFEVLPGETFKDILAFSSGFADSAYKASVKVTQFTDRELQVKDINAKEFETYHPQTGDKFKIDKILNRYANRVYISGAVFREGNYELQKGMTIADLIKRADGLREDAFTSRGQIIRLKDDLTKEILSFDAKNVMSDPNALLLKREDSVVIKSIFDLRDEFYVSVQGEVRKQGFYDYRDSLTLEDIIVEAGGLTDAAFPQKIEVARLIKRDTLTAQDVRASEVIEINGIKDLSIRSKNIPLRPFDVVTVRRKPGFLELESVTVSGELQYPGPYVLAKREERVSDLVKRSGGFTPEAYIAGAYIKRYNHDEDVAIKKQRILSIQEQLKDTTSKVREDLEKDFDQIPLNMERILQTPGSTEDVVLKAKDELFVPKFNAQIRISGSVLFPTQIPYTNGYTVRDYLSAAGGVSEYGRKRKIYVLYANGKAASAKGFLFFRKFPEIKPGAEIIVPRKPERRGLSTGETIGIASALASLAGVVIAIIRL